MKRLLLGLFALLLLSGAGIAGWAYLDLRKAASHSKSGQYIVIPKGSSPSAITKKLVEEGIIRHEWPLLLYLKLSGAGSSLKAGEYDFASPITPLQAIEKLERGQRKLDHLTIIEG